MEGSILYIIGGVLVLVVIWYLFRELNSWHWKINERIKLLHKAVFFLEKISLQLGASQIESVLVEEKKNW
jgi:hypothetical protein